MSMEDGFEKYSGRKFNPEKDTILNQVYQSAKQAEMMGGQGMNDYVDEYGEEEGGEPENPFEKSLINYLHNIKDGNS